MPSVYEIVTDRIIKRIEESGELPWQKPWTGSPAAIGRHRNGLTGHVYRGFNAIITGFSEFSSPLWFTIRQVNAVGAKIRKGEHGTPIVYWLDLSKLKKKGEEKSEGDAGEPTETERKRFAMRYYLVWNADQIDDLPAKFVAAPPVVRPEFEPIDVCERIVAAYPEPAPPINVGGDRAFYRPSEDFIAMPTKSKFASGAEYYSTLFHEMTHSTGAAKRLGREGIVNFDKFGSDRYAKEELVAEMGAAFLSWFAGINPIVEDNSVAYLQGWVKRFKEQPKLLVEAAGQAEKSTRFILGDDAPPTTIEPAERIVLAPKPIAACCSECGEPKPIHGKGKCKSCYRKAWKAKSKELAAAV